MNPENIKTAFDICLEFCDQRFNAPFYTTLQQSKVAVATDAHMMLIVKNLSYLDGLEIRDRDLDIDHCVPTDWQYPFELVTADLRNEIKKYVYTQVHEIECKECDGTGEVEYTYNALNGLNIVRVLFAVVMAHYCMKTKTTNLSSNPTNLYAF